MSSLLKKLRPPYPTLLLTVAVVALAAACSGGGAAAPTQVPSLDGAPAAASAPATGAADTADAPEFPPVQQPETELTIPNDVPEALQIIWESWAFLGSDYVDRSKLDAESFSEAAVVGMLRELGDPQTAYISPEVLSADFQDVFEGKFEGIGAHVNMNRDGKLIIVSPIPGSPAEAAGIRSGDIILEVDGENLEGLTPLEAVAKIRGPRGSIASLLVKHLTASEPVIIEVERRVIPLVSVSLRSKPEDRFAHIRISNFYPNTPEALQQTLSQAKEDGAEGLILDLRGNPGGPLDATVDIASEFLEDGLILYYLDGSGRRREWTVRDGGIARDIPMVVLVNEFSASSSEVLAGTLQDHGRAVLIGSGTFGKGTVNHLRPLSNGGGLYITIGRWYTPLGRQIQDDGIQPDIEVVDRDAREADIKQLRRAKEELERLVGDSAKGAASLNP